MFMPGKPELFMGIMEWLDRLNGFPAVKVLCSIFGILFLVLSIKILRKMNGKKALMIIFTGFVWAILITPLICTFSNAVNYPNQSPKVPYTTIAYDREYSNFCLPVSWEEFMASPDKQFDTFYVWNQRIGLVPYASNSTEDAIKKGNVIVIVNPKDNINSEDVKRLRDAVAQGKKLLLLGSRDSIDKFNTFAKLFKIELLPESTAGCTAYYDGDKHVTLTGGGLTLKGGKPIVSTADGAQVGCEVEYGSGKVIAFADAGLFYNSSIGNINIVPVEYQRDIGRLEFWILKYLTGS
jgi:hypothetical protein